MALYAAHRQLLFYVDVHLSLNHSPQRADDTWLHMLSMLGYDRHQQSDTFDAAIQSCSSVHSCTKGCEQRSCHILHALNS